MLQSAENFKVTSNLNVVNISVIHFKCVAVCNGYEMDEKIFSYVTLSAHAVDISTVPDDKFYLLASTLVAAINHLGTLENDHYWAFMKEKVPNKMVKVLRQIFCTILKSVMLHKISNEFCFTWHCLWVWQHHVLPKSIKRIEFTHSAYGLNPFHITGLFPISLKSSGNQSFTGFLGGIETG